MLDPDAVNRADSPLPTASRSSAEVQQAEAQREQQNIQICQSAAKTRSSARRNADQVSERLARGIRRTGEVVTVKRNRRDITRVRKSTWAIIGTVLCIILATYALRQWLDSNDWAGLGQWFGGLGALIAVLIALRIANDERRREGRREVERLRVQAYYVKVLQTELANNGIRVSISNEGADPIINVDAVAVHIQHADGEKVRQCSAQGGKRLVLLPTDGPWEPLMMPTDFDLAGTTSDMIESGGRTEVEIVFEDLNGTRYRRIGDRPPAVDDLVG